jgi:HK97 gp10 family phage protein
MTDTVTIKGMDEINKILRELPAQVSRKLVYAALRRASKPMKDEAVNLAPKKSGTTKRAIVQVNNQFEDVPGIMIAPTKGKRVKDDAWYARFQELGTKGYGKRKRVWKSIAMDFKNGRLRRESRTVGYKNVGSGLPAVRFMERAFDSKKDQAMTNIKTELGNVITKYLRKNAPRYYVD